MRSRAFVSVLAVGVLLFAGLVACVNIAVPARALPLAASWQSLPEMPQGKAQGQIAESEGIIYVFGGVKNVTYPAQEYNVSVPDSYAFNTSSSSWTRIADMTYGVRAGVAMAGDDGLIYVFGGYNSSMVAYTQIYDPESNSWSLGTPMPHADSFITGAKGADGLMYVIGGVDGLGYVQIYNPVFDSWTAGANMASPRFAGTAVLMPDSSVILYLGGTNSFTTASSNCLSYDTYFNSWSTIADLPVAVAGGAAVAGPEGLVYFMGGGNNAYNTGGTIPGQEYYNETLSYHSNNNTWTYEADLPYGSRYGMAAVTPEGKIWYFGGNTNHTAFSHGAMQEVMRVTISLSNPTAAPGSSIFVQVTPQFANFEAYMYVFGGYLRSPSGFAYAASSMTISSDTAFAFELKIPSGAEAGNYTFVSTSFLAVDVGYLVAHIPIANMTVPVISQVPIVDQIAALQAEIDALQAALASDDANVSALSIQVAIMQAKLDGIIAGMAASGQVTGAAMDDLNGTLDDLQTQLNDFKTQIDRVESKADSGGIYTMLTLVLVVVVMALLVVVVMQARRKPPVLPEPPAPQA